MGRTVRLVAAALSVGMLATSSNAATAPSRAQLPNLVPLPAFDLSISSQGGERLLEFAVATANRGDFALDLKFEADGVSTEEAAAHQCIAWITNRVCSAREDVGSFEWHPDHGHHHFQDFALYEVRRFRKAGMPDMRRKGLVATSGKMSFCLIDVEQDRRPDSVWYMQPHPLYYTCLAGAGFQGISPGWRDVYGAGTQGQWFELAALADGEYALVITSDPAGRLLETDETDNRAALGFRLSEGTAEIETFCASEPGELRCDLVEEPEE